jgi:hypothetical protein
MVAHLVEPTSSTGSFIKLFKTLKRRLCCVVVLIVVPFTTPEEVGLSD